MATDSTKTRVIAFDKCLLTRLNDAANCVVDNPNHLFYLQQDEDVDDLTVDAATSRRNTGT